MHHKEFVKHHTAKINGRKRIVYKKANSKSDNPRLYIKCNDEYVAYGEYMKIGHSSKKVSGGGEEDITNITIKEYLGRQIKSQLKLTYEDNSIDTLQSTLLTAKVNGILQKPSAFFVYEYNNPDIINPPVINDNDTLESIITRLSYQLNLKNMITDDKYIKSITKIEITT